MNETESNVDKTKYNEEDKSDEACNTMTEMKRQSNDAGSTENCYSCDESTVYSVFENLREKLSSLSTISQF